MLNTKDGYAPHLHRYMEWRQTPRSRNTLTLYSAKNCVVCHKVRLVMAAKGITYDLIAVDTANPPEDLLLLAPHYHSVPTLVERDNAIYISNVIAEYLDERYPHPALMPAEPIFRAMHRIAVRQVEHDWVPQVQIIQSGIQARRPGTQAPARADPGVAAVLQKQ